MDDDDFADEIEDEENMDNFDVEAYISSNVAKNQKLANQIIQK